MLVSFRSTYEAAGIVADLATQVARRVTNSPERVDIEAFWPLR